MAAKKKAARQPEGVEAAVLEQAEKSAAPAGDRVPCVTCGASVLPGVACPTDGQVN